MGYRFFKISYQDKIEASNKHFFSLWNAFKVVVQSNAMMIHLQFASFDEGLQKWRWATLINDDSSPLHIMLGTRIKNIRC